MMRNARGKEKLSVINTPLGRIDKHNDPVTGKKRVGGIELIEDERIEG